jgi:hypothetical protein
MNVTAYLCKPARCTWTIPWSVWIPLAAVYSESFRGLKFIVGFQSTTIC